MFLLTRGNHARDDDGLRVQDVGFPSRQPHLSPNEV